MKKVKQYRKKPMNVKAIQYTGDNPSDVLDFCAAVSASLPNEVDTRRVWLMATCSTCGRPYLHHLWIRFDRDKVCPGDYIIRDAEGDFYTCRPKAFQDVYEEVPR